jgi:hypothetical protein
VSQDVIEHLQQQQQQQKESKQTQVPDIQPTTEPLVTESKMNELIEEKVEQRIKELRQADIKRRQLELERQQLYSEALRRDISLLKGRQRALEQLELHPELIRRQEAVANCYRQNPNHSLVCWQEVRDFQQAVYLAGMERLREQNRI